MLLLLLLLLLLPTAAFWRKPLPQKQYREEAGLYECNDTILYLFWFFSLFLSPFVSSFGRAGEPLWCSLVGASREVWYSCHFLLGGRIDCLVVGLFVGEEGVGEFCSIYGLVSFYLAQFVMMLWDS